MKTEYAPFNSEEKIPLFVDSSPGWAHFYDAGTDGTQNISTDISAGMQEYIFGRNVGESDFGIGSGIIAGTNPDRVLLTGAGKLKPKKAASVKKPSTKSSTKSPTMKPKKAASVKKSSTKSSTKPSTKSPTMKPKKATSVKKPSTKSSTKPSTMKPKKATSTKKTSAMKPKK